MPKIKSVTLTLALHLVSSPQPCITTFDVREIFARINAIWAGAGIGFRLGRVDTLDLSTWPAWDLFLAGFQASARTIHGYYGHWDNPPPDNQGSIDVINGISCKSQRCFWVRDHEDLLVKSPPLHRVSGHELGHILGLDHYGDPKGFLMTPNGPGESFQPHEIKIAKDTAERLRSGIAL